MKAIAWALIVVACSIPDPPDIRTPTGRAINGVIGLFAFIMFAIDIYYGV